LNNEYLNLELTDVSGKHVFSMDNIEFGQQSYDLSKLDQGVYTVKVYNDKAQIIKLDTYALRPLILYYFNLKFSKF